MEHRISMIFSKILTISNVSIEDMDSGKYVAMFKSTNPKIPNTIDLEKFRKPDALQPTERIFRIFYKNVLNGEIDRDKL